MFNVIWHFLAILSFASSGRYYMSLMHEKYVDLAHFFYYGNILGIKNPSGFLKNDGVHLNGAGVALVSKNLIKFARHMFSKTD